MNGEKLLTVGEAAKRAGVSIRTLRHYDEIGLLNPGCVSGESDPEFEVFDMKEIEAMKREYAQEARRRWGNTDAYAQSEKKHAAYGKAEYAGMQEEMNALFAQFAAVRGLSPEDEKVQALVKAWQAHITKWHYECTDEILAGLGQMYAADERFQKNIDKAGEGTAKLMSDAIAAYWQRNHA